MLPGSKSRNGAHGGLFLETGRVDMPKVTRVPVAVDPSLAAPTICTVLASETVEGQNRPE